ncbi:hypothetical protein GIB67_015223, partial [Kingdonia uniflora]
YERARAANAEEAEALAALRGLETARHLGLQRILLLSDCQRIVRAFRERSEDLSWGALTLAPDMRAAADFFLDFRFEERKKERERLREKMHSFAYRANALLTFAVTILAVMCSIASLSDNLNAPSPTAQVQVMNINWFQKQPNGNDEVSMSLDISANLESMFTWNTKQLQDHLFFLNENTPKNSDLFYPPLFPRLPPDSPGSSSDGGMIFPPYGANWSNNHLRRSCSVTDICMGSDPLGSGLGWKPCCTLQECIVFVFLAAEYETPQNSLNQVSLWDGIIPSKEHAKFQIRTTNKYRFIDQGSNLRGKDFNMTLHWHVMPKTGKMSADKIVMTGYSFPQVYR